MTSAGFFVWILEQAVQSISQGNASSQIILKKETLSCQQHQQDCIILTGLSPFPVLDPSLETKQQLKSLTMVLFSWLLLLLFLFPVLLLILSLNYVLLFLLHLFLLFLKWGLEMNLINGNIVSAKIPSLLGIGNTGWVMPFYCSDQRSLGKDLQFRWEFIYTEQWIM